MIREQIDINIELNKYISPIGAESFERKIITKINFFVIKLLSEGKKINGLEVGYKVRQIIEDSSFFLASPLTTTSNFIGTFYRNVDTFFNNKIVEKETHEYHFILNYDDQKELYICINRDIQKEREEKINNILEE